MKQPAMAPLAGSCARRPFRLVAPVGANLESPEWQATVPHAHGPHVLQGGHR